MRNRQVEQQPSDQADRPIPSRPGSPHDQTHAVAVRVARETARCGSRARAASRPPDPARPATPDGRARGRAADRAVRSTSVVCQWAISFARRSAGAGRPSRGARYSSSSMPGPFAARSAVIRSLRAEHVVQMFLLDVVVLALAGDLQPERVAVEAERRVGVVDHDGGVIDPEEHARGAARATWAAPLPGGNEMISRKCRSGSRK